MKLYQVHYITTVTPIIVSDNPDIHGNPNIPQLIHMIRYCIESSPTTAKLLLFPCATQQDECYALEVSPETIKSEITHCKELIAYWNTQPDHVKEKERSDVIIASQHHRIKYYNDLLKDIK